MHDDAVTSAESVKVAGLGRRRWLRSVYRPSRTARFFHASDAPVRAIMGPRGSGKSSACLREVVKRACAQEAYRGTRYSRFAVVRATYPELKSTTIRTWCSWLPEEIAPMVYGSPIECRLRFPLRDGTRVESDVYFLALERPADERKLKSLEVTGVYFNEATEVPQNVIEMSAPCLRYPPQRLGGPTWSGIWMDYNPPDENHYLYKLFEIKKPDGHAFFRQPPACFLSEDGRLSNNPQAENIENLPDGYGYYHKLAAGKSRDFVLVMVCGEYGYAGDGRAVYPEYRDSFHARENVELYAGLPLTLGWDFGLNPSSVFCQWTPKGQLRVADEAVADRMGLRQMIREMLRPKLQTEYRGFALAVGAGDPSGAARSAPDETSCFDVLREEGIPAAPAGTNSFPSRREAVARLLLETRDGEPALLVSHKAMLVRLGFQGRYHHERIHSAQADRWSEAPCKNLYSHPHDALQYVALGNRPPVTALAPGHLHKQARRIVVPSSAGWA